MSIVNHYETITQEVTGQVCIGETTYCDICKKEIDTKSGYWEVITGHHDWGDDSWESIQQFDVCSANCLIDKFNEYIKVSEKNNFNTQYFEVERVR